MALPSEIKRAFREWFPAKQKGSTWKEVYASYKRLSKNQLFKILCDEVSKNNGVLPIASRDLKHKSKEHSKKVLIMSIFNTINAGASK
jgi:hypothetical protein